MANEIALTGSLSLYKPSIMPAAICKSVVGGLATMTANYYSEGTILVNLTTTQIPLGLVTTPHWAFFENMDATNYIQLQVSSGGAVFARLVAGEPPCFIPLDPGMVPYALANSGTCLLNYLIIGL